MDIKFCNYRGLLVFANKNAGPKGERVGNPPVVFADYAVPLGVSRQPEFQFRKRNQVFNLSLTVIQC